MRKHQAMLIAAAFLAGCTAPAGTHGPNRANTAKMFEMPFPAVMLMQYEDGTEDFFEGKMFGHIGGSARYTFPDTPRGDCNGTYSTDGMSSMTCTDGFSFSFMYGKQAAKFSGVNVVRVDVDGVPTASAFGWGAKANRAAALNALASCPVGNCSL